MAPILTLAMRRAIKSITPVCGYCFSVACRCWAASFFFIPINSRITFKYLSLIETPWVPRNVILGTYAILAVIFYEALDIGAPIRGGHAVNDLGGIQKTIDVGWVARRQIFFRRQTLAVLIWWVLLALQTFTLFIDHAVNASAPIFGFNPSCSISSFDPLLVVTCLWSHLVNHNGCQRNDNACFRHFCIK